MLIASPAAATEWSSTEVELLHGSGFELGPETRDIFTLMHASGWKFGSNFFFFDVTQPFGDPTSIYGEWYPRFSLRKITGKKPGSGFLKDVSVALAINAGEDFRAYLGGVTMHLRVPGFSFFDVDLMAYDDQAESAITYIVTPAWSATFKLGKAAFRFRGFVDVIGPEGDRCMQVLAQPQLLFDLDRTWNTKAGLSIGIEYQFWKNKYGLEGVDESFPQLMVAWEF